MLVHTRQTVHMGVGCVFAPQPVISPTYALNFQRELSNHGLVFTQTQLPPGTIALFRDQKPLEVRVQHVGPGFASLTAIAPQPWATLDEFLDDARTAFSSYSATWPGEPLQLVQRECTIRQLYDVADEHAFKFLWERRLGKSADELIVFRRPVLGGGLRFFIPPTVPQADEPTADVRIESLFADARKLFIELQMKWGVPRMVDRLDPEPILRETDRFLAEEVVAFITGPDL